MVEDTVVRPATVPDDARCYTRVSSDFGSGLSGTTIAVATSAAAASVLMCRRSLAAAPISASRR